MIGVLVGITLGTVTGAAAFVLAIVSGLLGGPRLARVFIAGWGLMIVIKLGQYVLGVAEFAADGKAYTFMHLTPTGAGLFVVFSGLVPALLWAGFVTGGNYYE